MLFVDFVVHLVVLSVMAGNLKEHPVFECECNDLPKRREWELNWCTVKQGNSD